jgi:iron complex outermembrane receptor protein
VDGFEALSGIPTTDPPFGFIADTDELFVSRIPYDFKQEAIFGETTWTLYEILHLTAGVRWYTFTETRVLNFDGIFADPFEKNVNAADPSVIAPSETKSDGFNPRFIVSVTPTDDIELSLQAARGFRLGGINDPLNSSICGNPDDIPTFSPFTTFDDEKIWNYEAGAKVTLFDGLATINGAVFYSDIEDLQLNFDTSCSSRVVLNAPEARVVGGEVEIFARPLDNLDFSIGATYQDSELRSTLRNVVTNAPLTGAEKGNRLPTTPKFQLSAAASYTIPTIVRDMDGFVMVSYQHVGSRFTQIRDLDPAFLNPLNLFTNVGATSVATLTFDPKMSAYDLANVRVGVRNDRWELAFYINNLSDERAELALDRERDGRARVGFLTNQPRTYGLTTRVNYCARERERAGWRKPPRAFSFGGRAGRRAK